MSWFVREANPPWHVADVKGVRRLLELVPLKLVIDPLCILLRLEIRDGEVVPQLL